jgi:hypothetical protein
VWSAILLKENVWLKMSLLWNYRYLKPVQIIWVVNCHLL